MEATLKKRVIEEYLEGSTHRRLAKKYGIGKSTIGRWIQAHLGIIPKKMAPKEIVILPEMIREVKANVPDDVKELQHQLEQERLRVKLLTAIIEIAEEKFQIPIRKKSGTKPSIK